ncbi:MULTISPECIES: Abi family protein [Corynebacterium]|uniref:Abi family protein n=1 Tax=Corynebacterium TaxID=1716 RepID=UPI001643BEFA|nr:MULTISPECIES: Abi family protein [Corynebacterium]MCT1414626.1 Abi family protein [Corynebacterium sanguinis]MCT1443586.1 Abi family protein [Corynebacterium sanguinis]MCT1598010.1 Abi family protein [Corynebacterium sanguinis]WNI13138.1 Abi family protein [Corynebacterium sp. Z-1]
MIKIEWVSEDRLTPYIDRTWGCPDRARELYELDRRLSALLFEAISYIEVALRNSINAYLTETYGDDWYTQVEVGFDNRVRANITESWESLPKRFTSVNADRNRKLGGRVVAASMFRTWTNMLDKGDVSALPAPFDRADHDRIWDAMALNRVFPGARQIARQQDPDFEHHGLTRQWVYTKVFPVRQIRNRIAHHESLTPKGVPITGTNTRLTPRECHHACLELGAMIDRDLRSFLENLAVTNALNELDSFTGSLQT